LALAYLGTPVGVHLGFAGSALARWEVNRQPRVVQPTGAFGNLNELDASEVLRSDPDGSPNCAKVDQRLLVGSRVRMRTGQPQLSDRCPMDGGGFGVLVDPALRVHGVADLDRRGIEVQDVDVSLAREPVSRMLEPELTYRSRPKVGMVAWSVMPHLAG
jgi:hypothetical protein